MTAKKVMSTVAHVSTLAIVTASFTFALIYLRIALYCDAVGAPIMDDLRKAIL